MIVVHLTSSRFYGGPERQMLGLAEALAPQDQTVFLSFAEEGRCREFLGEVARRGWEGRALARDTPYLAAAVREIEHNLKWVKADVLCCHGYKADVLGLAAARRRGIPVIAVSRGWTGENFKVRCYEALDRVALHWMDRVVCVSANQAARVGRTGVSRSRVVVIHNAIDPERFGQLEASYREKLLALFPKPPGQIVGAAGRLSPEKGFQILVQAAARLVTRNRSVGLVLFGEGPLRDQLSRDIIAASLRDRVILAGFRADLDRFLPWLDVLVLPSFTEGLPNVVLEGCAVGVPIVATAVGGTPEIIQDGVTGFLVPPGNVTALAERLHAVLGALQGARMVGERGRRRVLEKFTFPVQAEQYRRLLANLGACSNTRALPANILRRGGSRAVNITTTSPTGR